MNQPFCTKFHDLLGCSKTKNILAMIVLALFLADCTEFSSTYPSNDITLEQAIQNGVNVVITGQPGSGKSIALADLAAKIVKSDPSVKRLWKTFPVLVHVSDIDLTSKKFNDPLDRIVETISENISNLFRRRLPRFMKFMAYHGRLLILVDGLDELPLPALDSAVKYLYTLTKRYPKARIITTSTPEFMDGLTNIGFYPLQITSWNLQTINLFL